MEGARGKFKPVHGVLIAVMLILAVAFFFFRDKLTPDLNAQYHDELGSFIGTPAAVVSKEAQKGRRGSRIEVTVQFRNREGELCTARIDDNALQFVSEGDTVVVYYDPANPRDARSERTYKEIMKIK